jgi:hypothetical protein
MVHAEEKIKTHEIYYEYVDHINAYTHVAM